MKSLSNVACGVVLAATGGMATAHAQVLLFEQPVDPTGGVHKSAWYAPDGLDSDIADGCSELARETERLAKSCLRLVWLNPLLRYERFQAKPAGIRAMLPHVDAFLPVHNLESLAQIGEALTRVARASRQPGAFRGLLDAA